ncbi:NAD(P)/FAD-dependent oxidoreductase [Roseitranquillus sediminis]|uniref:NAD(P)/FAD-dependent oxidoreductase n=1 Tax=Roseitranquillus sediminis TaxID=2809051 RepID=UPI001D0C7874|nr:NAD(P)/FAD-dependent oxidoreductase [Roseitranquillus sediminis]MBM9595489.1 FAD-dependent oxidoreductase [Roseitranquillus sediminis]
MSAGPSRRTVLRIAGAASLSLAAPHVARGQSAGRVVVVGGGFGGATCARYLRALAPEIGVTLVEEHDSFVTCPFSNTVIAGLNGMDFITHGFDGLAGAGVTVVRGRVASIDADGGQVVLADGSSVSFDRLVVSPGVDFKWGTIEGYDPETAEIMPHAWKAGPQTGILRRQLEDMEDGGVFLMSIPVNPFRCPPGPYERASLVAHYLKTHKPRSKIVLIDAKDSFSKQPLFMEGWEQLYPGMIEWLPFADTGYVLRVEPETKTVVSEFGRHSGDVVNLIPPQRAADLAVDGGLTDGDEWCRIDQRTFESAVMPGVHVLGDAAIAGAMPKSGFSASSQGKSCALALAAILQDEEPPEPSLINTCYSLVAPDYGISVADVFHLADDGTLKAVEGAGGVSPPNAGPEFRASEADYARGWYRSMMTDLYG